MSQPVHDSENRVGLSDNLRTTLRRAGKYAAEQNHRLVTIEHILLALNKDPEAELIFKSCAVNQDKLYTDAYNHIGSLNDRYASDGKVAPMLDSEATRIVNSAALAAQKSKRNEVNGAIVLAAIIGDGQTPAAKMLGSQGLTFQAAISALQLSQNSNSYDSSSLKPPASIDAETSSQSNNLCASEDYTMNNPKHGHNSIKNKLYQHAKTDESLARFERRSSHNSLPVNSTISSKAQQSNSGTPLQETSHIASSFKEQPANSSNTMLSNFPLMQNTDACSLKQQKTKITSSDILTSRRRYSDTQSLPKSYAVTPDIKPNFSQSSDPTQSTHLKHDYSKNLILDNVPRSIRIGFTQVIDIQIANTVFQNFSENVQLDEASNHRNIILDEAIVARFLPLDDTFYVESVYPEMLWIKKNQEKQPNDNNNWRWKITPKRSGRGTLKLVMSSITNLKNGSISEKQFLDQQFEIRVSTNYIRIVMRWCGWIVAASVGSLITLSGDNIVRILEKVIRNGIDYAL